MVFINRPSIIVLEADVDGVADLFQQDKPSILENYAKMRHSIPKVRQVEPKSEDINRS